MPFNPNVPQATDFLSDSQSELLQNNLQLDTSFGIDHYTFSNLTAENGKHNQVTTPLIVGGVHPTTSATELKFYAMQDTAEIGLLQYSRGWDTANATSAVPSPVTFLQSPSTELTIAVGGGDIPLIDLVNVTNFAIGTVYAFSKHTTSNTPRFFIQYDFVWRKTIGTYSIMEVASTGSSQWSVNQSGSVLVLRAGGGAAATDQIYWTLQFLRIQL